MDFNLLDGILSPEDVKHLSMEELQALADQLRQRIIDVMAAGGGHLASNLGTIEISLALHRVFNSPHDKFIFDVSHQTYTHKLLTGRQKAFERVRKYKGLCGFAHPKESEHDHFYAGHAGTALSLGLGCAATRDLHDGDEHVIPIIGDATLTCGLSLEALNNIPRDLKRFLVILNDNEMSISHNVGGITHILSRLLSNATTNKWVHELERLVSKIPRYGSQLAKGGVKLKDSMKNLVSSAPFFEQFGLSYVGPIDGHNLEQLVPVLETLKDAPRPVILHLFTKKGQGLDKAEEDPITYHGAKPFDPETCEFLPAASKKPTFPKIFGKQLLEMGAEDPSLTVVTPAMSRGSCLDTFFEKFPDRAFDVGIAEGHAVTFSGGLAKGGKSRVVCSIYATFLQRALDNLFHDVCLQELPVVFAIDRASLSPADGSTHHGIYDISFLKSMPNMVICQPRNGQILKELMEEAFSWKRPVALRYPNLPTESEASPLRPRPLGKGEVLAEGSDLLIVALGHMCEAAVKMRALLLEKGIKAAVVDPIFVKPLDTELLVGHTRIVTLEEHSLKGGLGAEINNFLLSQGFSNVQVLNFGIPEAYIEHGSHGELLEELGLTPEKMVQRTLTHFQLHDHSALREHEEARLV